MDERDQDFERIKKAVEDLSEFFDSVHIFCTRHDSDDEGTVGWQYGSGNWHARMGQIRDWISDRDARTLWEAKKKVEE